MNNHHCFIDTSAFIALNHAGDHNHNAALNAALQLNGYQLVTSDLVISETYTILRYRFGYTYAERFLTTVLAQHEYDITEITPVMRRESLLLLGKFQDQKISFCDAMSVILMRYKKINDIFAFDHHFELMGVRLINRIF